MDVAELEDAIREYVSQQLGNDTESSEIVTGWIVLASTYIHGNESANGYWKIIPPTQALHVSLGLLEGARQSYLATALASVSGSND